MDLQLRQDALTWHVLGSDVIVLDLEGSVYLKLNGPGRLLWERLVEPCDRDVLADALVDEYGIDRNQAVDDVAAFVDDLRGRNLLVA